MEIDITSPICKMKLGFTDTGETSRISTMVPASHCDLTVEGVAVTLCIRPAGRENV